MAHDNIRGCIILKDLYYNIENNTWVKVVDENTVAIGMTDVAQNLAGPILHAKTKAVGTVRKAGRPIATVESGKYVGPVKAPVNGEITKVNENLANDAQLINRSPYRDGWVVEMTTDNLEEELKGMVTGDAAVEAYKAKIEADNIEACTHLEGSDTYE